jgi:hypothetical protein
MACEQVIVRHKNPYLLLGFNPGPLVSGPQTTRPAARQIPHDLIYIQ